MGVRYRVTGEAFRSYGRVYKPGEEIYISREAAAPLLEARMIAVPPAADLRQQVAALIEQGQIVSARELVADAAHYYSEQDWSADARAVELAWVEHLRREFWGALAGGVERTIRCNLNDLQDACAEEGLDCQSEEQAYVAAFAADRIAAT